MYNVLALQQIAAKPGMDPCILSSVSCSSNASCDSHLSSADTTID